MARFFQALQIPPPFGLVLCPQVVEYRPRVEPRIVPVIEDEPHSVTPDRLNSVDIYPLFPDHQQALTPTVPFNLGGR